MLRHGPRRHGHASCPDSVWSPMSKVLTSYDARRCERICNTANALPVPDGTFPGPHYFPPTLISACPVYVTVLLPRVRRSLPHGVKHARASLKVTSDGASTS